MTDKPEMLRLLAEAARPSLSEIRQDQEDAPPTITEMLRYLEGALFDPMLNVMTWKKAIGVRDNSIAILFHAFIGTPPKAYITRHRLATAKRLLQETQLKVWQIGELLGYSSLGVFSKAFARETGQRPKEYRKHRVRRESNVSSGFSDAERQAALRGQLPEDRAYELVGRILSMYPEIAHRSHGAEVVPAVLVDGDGVSPC